MTELITYDIIRKVHRIEKYEIALQKIPDNFFVLVRNWLDRKQTMQKGAAYLLEMENAKKLLEDLINRRQKKLVISALHTVRGDMPPKNMAPEEEKFFDNLVNIMRRFRQDLQEQMFGYDSIIEEKLESAKMLIQEIKMDKNENKSALEKKDEIAAKEPEDKEKEQNNGTIKLEITADMPSFVDSEMKSYGPFKAGAIVQVPKDIAQILLARKVAKPV